MSEKDQKREVRRMMRLLQQIAELADHVEQTGSFESGAQNSVRRYNAIVEHLENIEVLPDSLFPSLEEKADFGQLGAEATLLANYLAESDEETGKSAPPGKSDAPDIHTVLALAPFLEQAELSKIVRTHFPGNVSHTEEASSMAQGPDLRTLAALAPHLDSETLAELARHCLARQPVSDPQMLVALAPHMKSKDFGQLLRQHMPGWFGQPGPTPEPKPESDPDSQKPTSGMEWGNWSDQITPPTLGEERQKES